MLPGYVSKPGNTTSKGAHILLVIKVTPALEIQADGGRFQPADTVTQGKHFDREKQLLTWIPQHSLDQEQWPQPPVKGLSWKENYTALAFPSCFPCKCGESAERPTFRSVNMQDLQQQ